MERAMVEQGKPLKAGRKRSRLLDGLIFLFLHAFQLALMLRYRDEEPGLGGK